MSETRAVYAVDMALDLLVECPNCHTNIGRIVTRKGERWLAVGSVLVLYLPGSTLCAGCKSPVHYGEPHRQRVSRPGEIWDGKKFVKMEGK